MAMYSVESIGFHDEDKVILAGLQILSPGLLACILWSVLPHTGHIYWLGNMQLMLRLSISVSKFSRVPSSGASVLSV